MAELRAPEPIGFKKETGCSVYCQSPVIVPHPFSHYFLVYGKDRVFVESVISLVVEGVMIYGKCTVTGFFILM